MPGAGLGGGLKGWARSGDIGNKVYKSEEGDGETGEGREGFKRTSEPQKKKKLVACNEM